MKGLLCCLVVLAFVCAASADLNADLEKLEKLVLAPSSGASDVDAEGNANSDNGAAAIQAR
jgi:hypothetical protein